MDEIESIGNFMDIFYEMRPTLRPTYGGTGEIE